MLLLADDLHAAYQEVLPHAMCTTALHACLDAARH